MPVEKHLDTGKRQLEGHLYNSVNSLLVRRMILLFFRPGISVRKWLKNLLSLGENHSLM